MSQSNSILLLCTNDLHSYADRFSSIQHTIADIRQHRPSLPFVQLDAGDWFSGTVYSWLGPQANLDGCVELDYFRSSGVITCLGNHEFDATVQGLANMLEKAARKRFHGIVCSNIVLHAACKLSSYYSAKLEIPKVVNESLIVNVPDFGKVGVLGLMGDDAIYGCRASVLGQGVTFLPRDASARKCRKLSKTLREMGCRLVILLFHGGKEEFAHYNLSSVVDFCVCGHTHQAYPATPKELVSQASCNGLQLGVHELALDRNGKPKLVKSEIVRVVRPLNDGDSQQRHPSYDAEVKSLLKTVGVEIDTLPVTILPTEAQLPLHRDTNCPFAIWICDALLFELRKAFKQEEIHGFFFANELIRGDFTNSKTKGYLTLSDIAETIECGQSSADAVGVEIWLIEATPIQLLYLHCAFMIGTLFITANARPAYSTGFLSICTPRALMLRNNKKVLVATTKFLAESVGSAMPRAIFDATSPIKAQRHSLSILLFKHLQRNMNSTAKL